jgi:hypothetical protein
MVSDIIEDAIIAECQVFIVMLSVAILNVIYAECRGTFKTACLNIGPVDIIDDYFVGLIYVAAGSTSI